MELGDTDIADVRWRMGWGTTAFDGPVEHLLALRQRGYCSER